MLTIRRFSIKINGNVISEMIDVMDNKIQIEKNMVFSSSNNEEIYKAFDGKARTKWIGKAYPGYINISFGCYYQISGLKISMSHEGYSLFSVYSSEDGVNFEEKLCQDSETSDKGEYSFDCNFKSCALRLYIKYVSSSDFIAVKNISVFGKKSDDKFVQSTVNYPEDYGNSPYNVDLTEKDTINELHALVGRTIGKEYCGCFVFEIDDSDREYFEICDHDDKIKIKANSGVNAAAGLNYYYKRYCGVHISQVGNNVKMPEKLPEVGNRLYRETPFKIRYSYNYCALSYTMAFWQEDEWQKELDRLALQGVNVVLDITAIEEVYRRFLLEIGYTMDEVKAFITGPAYYAWFNMANIFGVGGPLPDGFFEKHTALARRNHLFMRKMGMQPVLQGYSGMVPVDIRKHIPAAPVIPQGKWNALDRPYMLKTDSETYRMLARLFYQCQKDVFGGVSHYYATDPFHEGGKSGRIKIENVGKQIIASILESDPDGIWIIQSWGENPSKQLLDGIGDKKDHALILDLYAEKKPRWKDYLGKEFLSTPWVYCMLNNFGGRMGLHGHLRTIATEIANAYSQADYMKGIGITPEATFSNPIIYDLFFETAWSESGNPEPIDLKEWLKGYAKRRYGSCSDKMYEALLLLNNTVYNPDLNENGEGAPESVVNARPSFKVKSPSTWGNNIVAYDKTEFEKAVSLFAGCYDECRTFDGYMFDLVDLLKQVISNTAAEYQQKMINAYQNKDLIEFMKISDKFISMIRFNDQLLSRRKEFLLGNWLNQAKQLADDFDEFTKHIFEFNARALITTWAGSRAAANEGGLADYSNKQWSGLTADFYLMRWKKWIENCISSLSGNKEESMDWFRLENRWTWQRNEYSDVPTEFKFPEDVNTVLNQYNFSSSR